MEFSWCTTGYPRASLLPWGNLLKIGCPEGWKKTNLALRLSRVGYGPECPGLPQGIQRHPRVTQSCLATKVIFLMHKHPASSCSQQCGVATYGMKICHCGWCAHRRCWTEEGPLPPCEQRLAAAAQGLCVIQRVGNVVVKIQKSKRKTCS